MKKEGLSKSLIVCICLMFLFPAGLILGDTIASAKSKVVMLKAIRPFAIDHRESYFYKELLDRVNERMKGRLQIKDMGGSEVYPVHEQIEAVKDGVIDYVISPADYFAGVFPESLAVYLTFAAKPPELRKAGFIEALDGICRQRNNVAIVAACDYFQYNIYLKKPVKTAKDFKGRKIRVVALYIPVIEGLGGSAVSIPFTETYTALEKGVVDGFCWPATGAADLGFHEQVSYQVYPYFWTSCSQLMFMNAKKLDTLPKDIKKDFLAIIMELEKETYTLSQEFVKKELKVTRPAGLKPVTVTEKDWWKVQKLHWEGTLEKLRKIAPENTDKLEKIIVDAGWYPPKTMPEAPEM